MIDLPYLVTILALTAKFAISFTYNGIYIITAEMYPTVIRNSAVSFCQTFARLGAVLAPNFQLLVSLTFSLIIFSHIYSYLILTSTTTKGRYVLVSDTFHHIRCVFVDFSCFVFLLHA